MGGTISVSSPRARSTVEKEIPVILLTRNDGDLCLRSKAALDAACHPTHSPEWVER